MDASCTIQDSIHVFSLVHKYVSSILGTYHFPLFREGFYFSCLTISIIIFCSVLYKKGLQKKILFHSPIRLSFNHNRLLFRKLLLPFLREGKLQNPLFKLCFYIFLLNALSNIKASLHRAGVTFLTNEFSFLILLLFI